MQFDRSGTTRIGKYLLNHSFMLPGLISTAGSVGFGLLIAKTFYRQAH
jgi:anaerobic C4-dicarboxylate transporter DcuA